jgi:glycosyltransferase involved in cell wall biosynthesis
VIKILYISYDGMLEPLGQSQVLAYQQRLAQAFDVHLLSFEKSEDWIHASARNSLAERTRAAGIHWHARRYHKRPTVLATAYDVLVGVISGLWLVLRHRVRVVHARSYVAAVVALALKKLVGVRFIFDMRGFWADERVDGGLWVRDGYLYRAAKWFERHFLLEADHVVSLTHAAVREIENFAYLGRRMPPISVIPTCADLTRFKPGTLSRDDTHFVLGYVGSAGTWYLFDHVIEAFSELLRLRANARLLILNRGEHAFIRERLTVAGISLDAVELRAATHAEVPQHMARMHAGIFFYRPSYSRAACAPTKLGEFLGCGIPCLSNAGVGDMAEILVGERVGVSLKAFDRASLVDGLIQLLALATDEATSERCVAAAQRHFSLDEGAARYQKIYEGVGA